MRTLKDVVAVVPALNEEEGLGVVLSGLKRAGVREVVVIDGRSKDSTVKVARGFGAKVVVQEGRGKAMGFRTFLKRYPIDEGKKYVMLDADGTYAPSEIGVLADALGRFDVVAGIRPKVVTGPLTFVLVNGGFAISLIASVLYLKWHPDVCTGYWGFTGRALKRLEISSRGFDLEVNLFSESVKKGLSLGFVPISYADRLGEKKLSIGDGLFIVARLFAERFRAA